MARLMDKLFSLTHELHDLKKRIMNSRPLHSEFITEIDMLIMKVCGLYGKATELDHAVVFNGHVRSRIEEFKRKIDLLWSHSERLKNRWNIEMTWDEANRTLDPRYQTLFSSSDEESIISLQHARQKNQQQQNPPSRASSSSFSSTSITTTTGSKTSRNPQSSNRDINSSSVPQRRRFDITSLTSLKWVFTFRK